MAGIVGRPSDQLHAGHHRCQLRAHRLDRLERHHAGAARDQQPGQLAGPGAELEHGPAGTEVQPLDDRRDGIGGIGRPCALVGIRGCGKPARRGIVHPVGHHRLLVQRRIGDAQDHERGTAVGNLAPGQGIRIVQGAEIDVHQAKR